MFEGQSAVGFESGFGDFHTLTVRINKFDNGYAVNLDETRVNEPVVPPIEKEATNPDEALDTLIDGMVAFTKFISDRGSGEDWKGDEDREKVRRAIETIFPSVSHHPPYYRTSSPRSERKVFESKAALIAYLEKNL